MPRIKIEKLVFGGQGLGRYDNKVCFIWNALPGEEVEFKVIKNHKNFSEGLATKIYTASPYRIKPLEDHFLICSPLQILDYAEENRLKVEMAKENYHKLAGLDFDDLEIVSSEKSDHYRNKMEYSFVEDKKKISLAFFERGEQKHIPINGCELADKDINLAAQSILDWLNEVKPSVMGLKSLILRSNGAGKVIAALFVKNKEGFDYYPELSERVIGFHVYYSNPYSPVSVPTEVMHKDGQNYLLADLNGYKLKFGLLSFFKVNIPVFNKALSDIENLLKKGDDVIDFYGGVGAISIPLLKKCGSSIIVDNNSEAIDYAKENIKLNNLKNYSAELKSAEKLYSLIEEDKILILDPPREGLHPRITERILEQMPKRIFYLSCDLATQARDLKLLKEKYKVSFSRLYNFFPRTPHVEGLCVLEKK